MRGLVIIFSMLILTSCSSSRIDRKIDDVTWDGLADESYLRWGEDRLKKANPNHKVVSCYKGEIIKTLESFKKDYITKSESDYYWLHIGNCYFIQGSWSKAEFFYRLALEEARIPTIKSVALNNIGLIHFKYEQWNKGKQFLIQSMNLAPKLKVPRYNMSQLYLQFGHYDKAIEVLSQSVFRGHKDIDIYFSLANAWLYKGNFEKASDYFSMIPKKHFKREDIAATYALFLIQKGQSKEASAVMKDRERSNVAALTAISHKIEKILLQKLKEE